MKTEIGRFGAGETSSSPGLGQQEDFSHRSTPVRGISNALNSAKSVVNIPFASVDVKAGSHHHQHFVQNC